MSGLDEPAWLHRGRTVGPLLILIVVVVYAAGIVNGAFHYDDSHHIVENPSIRSLANLPRFFSEPALWSGEPGNMMYRPVGLVSAALDFALWKSLAGQGYHATGWLVTNALLHALVALLVWRVALRIGLSAWAALVAGLVMALHPVHSEVVNYVSARSEALAAVLLLGALLAHLGARETEGGRRYGLFALAWSLAALALLSKETAAGFCAVIALYELIASRDAPALRVKRAIGYAALYGTALVGFLLLRQAMIGHATAPIAVVASGGAASTGKPAILDYLLFTQSRVVVQYFELLLSPVRLSIDHQPGIGRSLAAADVVSLLLHASILGAAVAAALRGRRLFPLTVGWFWVLLAPSIAFPLNVVMNEHRLYLPGVAVALLAGAALARVGSVIATRRGLAAGWAASCLPLALFAPLVIDRSLEWRDDVTLWTAAVERSPRSERAYMHLGASYHEDSGKLDGDAYVAELDRVLGLYQRADELKPDWYDLQLNIGTAWLARGRVTREETDLERALTAFKSAGVIVGLHKPRPRYLQAAVLTELGRFDAALAIMRKLDEEDDAVTTLYDDAIARILRRSGDRQGAAEHMQRVIAVEEPQKKVDGLLTLGWWNFEDGNLTEAERYLGEAYDKVGQDRSFDKGFRAALHIARFLNLQGQPEAAEQFVNRALNLGWSAAPRELAWVRGGRTPGAPTGVR